MDREVEKFQARLIRYLLSVLNERSESFLGILAKSQNCDPAFLLDTLREMEARGLIHVSGEAQSREYRSARHAGLSSRIEVERASAAQIGDSARYCQDVVGSNYFKELASAVLGSLPEPGLVYSQWWFSEPIYARLIDLLLGLSKKGRQLAFLGSSTLGAVFSQCMTSPATIIDVDEVLLHRIRTCVSDSCEIVHRDISNPPDTSLRSRFDTVVADPPWSSSYLRTFFVRSAEMLAPEGTLITSFPPVFTRPSARAERKSLLRMAQPLGLSFTTELTAFTEYAVPSFEYRAYKEHGIELGQPWRRGDLLIFKKRNKATQSADIPVEPCWKWDQYDYGTTRLFLKRNGSVEEGPARIVPISGRNDFAYDSTSSRTQLWKRASLVSTRNQIADISGKKQLTVVLQELLDKTADLSNALKCLSGVRSDTQAALSILVNDSDDKNGKRGESKWCLQMENYSESVWNGWRKRFSNHMP